MNSFMSSHCGTLDLESDYSSRGGCGDTGLIPGPAQWVKGIWCCYNCSVGHSCGSDSIPGLRTFICCKCSYKIKNKSERIEMGQFLQCPGWTKQGEALHPLCVIHLSIQKLMTGFASEEDWLRVQGEREFSFSLYACVYLVNCVQCMSTYSQSNVLRRGY